MSNRPIGIFDSGIGGLTVFEKIREFLPSEDIIYLGDTARVPYGTKSPRTIVRFSIENVLFLLRHNVKLVVVACNSSSAVSLKFLSENFKVPVIGVIKPGAEHALRISKRRRIGIIGTELTIRTGAYQKEIRKSAKNITIIAQSCPLFVPFIETGWIDHPITKKVIAAYLKSFKGTVDTLILGCTHYPIIKPQIKEFLPEVQLVDSSEQTAVSVRNILDINNLRSHNKKGTNTVFVTDDPVRFKRVSAIFLKRPIAHAELVRDGAFA